MSSGLPLVPGFISRFIENWAARRQPESQTHITLVRQRLYILPTRSGVAFFIVLLVILLGAINYQNSVGFMLTFLLASIGCLSMLHTHQNLNGLRITSLPASPVFAGQLAQFPITLDTRRAKTTYLNIKFQCSDDYVSSASLNHDQQDTQFRIAVPTQRRGRLSLPKIKIYTEFPLGLFHAWTWVNISCSCIIYPQPGQQPLHIQQQGKLGQLSRSDSAGSDDFAGIREYQRGDAPNHLAWKAIARSGQLQTKLFSTEAGNEIWLSWSQFNDRVDVETRLSNLCRWVLDADQQGIRYGLDLPGIRIEPAGGLHHRQLCLQQLALFGEISST